VRPYEQPSKQFKMKKSIGSKLFANCHNAICKRNSLVRKPKNSQKKERIPIRPSARYYLSTSDSFSNPNNLQSGSKLLIIKSTTEAQYSWMACRNASCFVEVRRCKYCDEPSGNSQKRWNNIWLLDSYCGVMA
jgi:hypothetical protein